MEMHVEKRIDKARNRFWIVLDFCQCVERDVDRKTTLELVRLWTSSGAHCHALLDGMVQLRLTDPEWEREASSVYDKIRWDRTTTVEVEKLAACAQRRNDSVWSHVSKYGETVLEALRPFRRVELRLFERTRDSLRKNGALAARSVALFRGSREQLEWCLKELDG